MELLDEGPNGWKTKLDAGPDWIQDQIRVTEPKWFQDHILLFNGQTRACPDLILDIDGGEITYAGLVPTHFDHKSLQGV